MFQLRGELRTTYAELERAGHAPSWETLKPPSEVPLEIRHVHGRFLALAMALAEQFESIITTGVLVKDPEEGLCDFPSQRGDRPVLLCWKLGERAVSHWHELHTGFAGRQPIDEDPAAADDAGDADDGDHADSRAASPARHDLA